MVRIYVRECCAHLVGQGMLVTDVLVTVSWSSDGDLGMLARLVVVEDARQQIVARVLGQFTLNGSNTNRSGEVRSSLNTLPTSYIIFYSTSLKKQNIMKWINEEMNEMTQ